MRHPLLSRPLSSVREESYLKLVLVLAATAAVPGFFSSMGEAETATIMASTAALMFVFVRYLFAAASGEAALLRALLFAPALGCVNAGTSLALLELQQGNVGHAAAGFLLGMTFGATLGAPIGFLYGLFSLLPFAMVHRLRRRDHLASREMVIGTAALFLLLVAFLLRSLGQESDLSTASQAVLFAFGAGGITYASLLLVRRARWLARLRRERVPGYRLTAPAAGVAVEALPAFWPWSGTETVLVRTSGRVGYRRGDGLPMARL